MYAPPQRRKCVETLEVEDERNEISACIGVRAGRDPAAEREAHFTLAHSLLRERAEERVLLPNGYAIRFPPEALTEVAHFVANERKCCPFMSFELSIAPESGPLWLRMTGPEGVRRVLDAELDLAGSCGCGEGASNEQCR